MMSSKRLFGLVLACLLAVGTLMGTASVAFASSADDLEALGTVDCEVYGAAEIDSMLATDTTPVSVNAVPNSQTVDNVFNIEDLPHEQLNWDDIILLDINEHGRATKSINWSISGSSAVAAASSYSMEVGETLTINCSYSPSSASVDYGFISPSGVFYYVNSSNGSCNATFNVNVRGEYTLCIRNNSTNTVSLVGFVNY